MRFRIAALLLGAAALAGCSGDATAPQEGGLIAVSGTLYVGETISMPNAILVTRVEAVDAFYDRAKAAVNDAVVTIERDGAAAPDTLALLDSGRYTNSSIEIEPLTTYRLRVAIPGGRVITAKTTTPHSFTTEGGPPVAPNPIAHAVLQDSFPILVRCEDPRQIFVVDAYCWENWEDARSINPFGSRNAPSDYREYGGDNGQPRHISGFFRLEHIAKRGDAYLIDFYSAMIAFYGTNEIQVLSVDDNIYNALYRDHPEENGGIVGGVGLFGSAERRRWNLEVRP